MKETMKENKFLIYIDTGGTFSDAIIISSDGKFTTGKAPTTPDDLEKFFFNCIEDAAKKWSYLNFASRYR